MPNHVQLSRDPFARMTLVRVVTKATRSCDWCGNRPGRFFYYWSEDAGNWRLKTWAADATKFCCVSCYRSYHS